jgi:hypothetical protein
MEAKTVRYPVADLTARFGISKTILYQRIKVLKIQTFRVGVAAYVNGAQFALLNALDEHLKSGQSTAEFLEASGLLAQEPPPHPIEPFHEQVAAAIGQPPATVQTDVQCPLHWTERIRFLEDAHTHRWLLSTSQLAELIGISPATLARMQECDRNGFQFVRAGMNGSEIAWEVKKLKSKRS